MGSGHPLALEPIGFASQGVNNGIAEETSPPRPCVEGARRILIFRMLFGHILHPGFRGVRASPCSPTGLTRCQSPGTRRRTPYRQDFLTQEVISSALHGEEKFDWALTRAAIVNTPVLLAGIEEETFREGHR